tara:strand:+ start:873 stop:1253 length:381 start_codon:yes stop_codon:yes gene_type:complete
MAKMLGLKLDLSKLKSAPYTTSKGAKCIMIPLEQEGIYEGKKGTYLDVTVAVNDELNEYDQDCSAWIAQSKENREAGGAKNYLGNGKVFWTDEQGGLPAKAQEAEKEKPANTKAADFSDDADDLPF